MTMIVSEKRFWEFWNNDDSPDGLLEFVDSRYRLLLGRKFLISEVSPEIRDFCLNSFKKDIERLERILCSH